jgi:hypothetical protein
MIAVIIGHCQVRQLSQEIAYICSLKFFLYVSLRLLVRK